MRSLSHHADQASNTNPEHDLRATTFTARIAALARDAGTLTNLEPACTLRAEIRDAGITAAQAALELAFHHCVQDEHDKARAAITRPRDLAQAGDYAYYADIAHYTADLPLENPSPARWLDGQDPTRNRWRSLVTARRA
ncbi:hypothetical protein [Streptomyces sp. NPDC055709]